MDWLERLAEERIREAIRLRQGSGEQVERGEFDDLPLAGKPISLESNGFVPEDLRLAYKLLKDAEFLPPEMELRKEIVSLKELLATVDDEGKRLKVRRRIDDLALRLDLLLKR